MLLICYWYDFYIVERSELRKMAEHTFMLQLIQMPTLSMKEMSLHPNFIMSERLNNMMNGVSGYERS